MQMFSLLLSRYLLRNNAIFIYSICLCVTIYVYYRRSNSPEEGDLEKRGRRKTEVSCHITKTNGVLQSLPSNASFPPKSIFFHETSCRGGLTSRQACVVESAAKSHPNHQINVLFTSAMSNNTLHESGLTTLLAKYKNVKLARVHIKDYARGTPLEWTVNSLSHDRLDMFIPKLMKYLTMFKYSGIYLSLDVVVARSFDDLWKNWVIRETKVILSSDMFSFSDNKVGNKLADIAIAYLVSEIALNNKHELWSYSGPTVMTQVLKLWCTTNKVQDMSLYTCDDLAVYGPQLFYPISFHNRAAYFRPIDWEIWKEQKIYTYPIWEYFTKYNIVTEYSLYARIAKEYCPTIFEEFDEQFGIYN